MKTFSLFIFSIFTLLSIQSLEGQDDNSEGWEFVREKDNVKVYRKEVGDRTAFRGIGIIEGTPEKLVGIIHNPKRWKFWIDDLNEGRNSKAGAGTSGVQPAAKHNPDRIPSKESEHVFI